MSAMSTTQHPHPRPDGAGTPPARPRRPLRRRLTIAAAVVVTVLAITAVSTAPIIGRWLDDPADAAPVPTTTVRIVDDAFEPPAAAVTTGTTVTWTWTGEEEHNVVFDDAASPLQVSGTWARTFDEAGEYGYQCTIHPFMDGRVVVSDA